MLQSLLASAKDLRGRTVHVDSFNFGRTATVPVMNIYDPQKNHRMDPLHGPTVASSISSCFPLLYLASGFTFEPEAKV